MTDTSQVTIVWSAYGHRFMGEDGGEACITCGARYTLIVPDPSDPTYGQYVNGAGEDPQECTHNTTMAHGYPGERVCPGAHDGPGATCDPSEPCEHIDHECNCLLCD